LHESSSNNYYLTTDKSGVTTKLINISNTVIHSPKK